MELGLLVIRVVVGLLFVGHGTQKLFGWFGGHGLKGTAGFFDSLGMRPGKHQAFLAGLAEAGGGALLALGLLTPLASAALIAGAAAAKVGFFKALLVAILALKKVLVVAVLALAAFVRKLFTRREKTPAQARPA